MKNDYDYEMWFRKRMKEFADEFDVNVIEIKETDKVKVKGK